MPEPQDLIVLEHIRHAYGGTEVLHNIHLSVGPKEFLTVLGPSGCGKTTLLRLIAGFETPTAGRVLLQGRDVTAEPPHLRKVNTVFQSYALFPHMSVFDNVAFGLRMSRVSAGDIRERVGRMLTMVAMEAKADRRPHQLSGGEQQRVAIARAAVNNPLVLLLDEPLSALDARLRRQMQGELKRLQRLLGITFIHVTHDQQEALALADRVVVMNDGSIEQIGTPVDVYENPNSLRVARFVGETNIFDATVLAGVPGSNNGSVRVRIQGHGRACSLKAKGSFRAGQNVHVVLRPEDLIVRRSPPQDAEDPWFSGRVDEIVYKGTTYDIFLTLESGKTLVVTKFFDQEDPEMIVSAGENVFVSWVGGWEVVLPDETKQRL